MPRFFMLYIPAMSNPYGEDGKMAEANKLLDEAKTFLYIGKFREARKVWDQEPLRDDTVYHETFWKKIYEDCYKEGYLKTSWWKRALGRLTRK
ncbi:MAG: hypothetical protein H0U54_10400 [Acidobacteria bacterium]|nr:hypothetical protein [Acidobacteriota bacterium]